MVTFDSNNAIFEYELNQFLQNTVKLLLLLYMHIILL